jgi:signal transduction histidine kinase
MNLLILIMETGNSVKKSIRRQYAFNFIILTTGVIMLCILINYIFLEKYYMHTKLNAIYDAYTRVGQAANSDEYDSASFMNELEDVCSRYNITICVMDAFSQTKYVSKNGGQQLESRLVSYIFGIPMDSYTDVIEEGTDYVVQKTVTDGNEYMEMYGRLNSGISFIMRTPLESTRESARLANRFFAYVGTTGALIGGIVIWFISKRITKPILELNSISEKMVKLDFEAKYTGGAHNEIDMLGENINKLSTSLEESISHLKTLNNELQNDIRHKEEIDERRQEFIANVSHELKTPIALIQGYAEGLHEAINDDPESREFYCDVIMDEASKMNSMVKKLLALNELESGNDTVTMERVDITALVKNYAQSAEILARQNGIKVVMEEYPPMYVWADEFKVDEVIANYFTNAVNHCEYDKIIEIKLTEKDGFVLVSVFNTGKPIPEDSLDNIWDKFYKVDKARTREYGGSGVGLSIVKAIMESMNRGYGVQNFEDGVMFWFELECVNADKDNILE